MCVSNWCPEIHQKKYTKKAESLRIWMIQVERWGDFPSSHSLVFGVVYFSVLKGISFLKRSASRSSCLFFEIEIEIDKEREIGCFKVLGTPQSMSINGSLFWQKKKHMCTYIYMYIYI